MSQNMRFHVLGLGSIGTFLAHHLRRAIPPEYPITLIHKHRSRADEFLVLGNTIHVEQDGLITSSTGYNVDAFASTPRWPAASQTIQRKVENQERQDYDTPIESLFVTTKAHQALPAIQQLAPRLSPNSTLVLLQNGMGLYEDLVNKIFRNADQRPHFILASNTHGIFTKGSHHVVQAGVGSIEFGIVPDPRGRNFEASLHDENLPPAQRALQVPDITNSNDPEYARYKSLRDTVAAILLLEPLDTKWKPMHEMQLVLRRKLVVNAVINPLTAIIGCRNGDLFVSDTTRRIMRDVCYEASQAFLAEFQSEANEWLNDLTEQDVDVNAVGVSSLPYTLTRTGLETEVLRVASITRGNISSMLSDIRQGKQTEINYINGFLLKIGRMHNIRMPVNRTLVDLVKLRSAIPLDQQL